MKRTPEELVELRELKKKSGVRYYAACRIVGTHPYMKAELAKVSDAGSLETAVKYFKAQHNQREMFLCECVCNVSRYGSVSYGCFKVVDHDCNRS